MGPFKFKFPKPKVILERLKIFDCPSCDRHFLNRAELNEHVANHEVKFPNTEWLDRSLVIDCVPKKCLLSRSYGRPTTSSFEVQRISKSGGVETVAVSRNWDTLAAILGSKVSAKVASAGDDPTLDFVDNDDDWFMGDDLQEIDENEVLLDEADFPDFDQSEGEVFYLIFNIVHLHLNSLTNFKEDHTSFKIRFIFPISC